MWRSGPGVANNIRAHRIRSWRCGVWVQAWPTTSGPTASPTASGAGDVAFGSRRGQQHPRSPHPELAMWRSGPGVPSCIRSWQTRSRQQRGGGGGEGGGGEGEEEETGEEGEEGEGVASLLKSRDPPGRRTGFCLFRATFGGTSKKLAFYQFHQEENNMYSSHRECGS